MMTVFLFFLTGVCLFVGAGVYWIFSDTTPYLPMSDKTLEELEQAHTDALIKQIEAERSYDWHKRLMENTLKRLHEDYGDLLTPGEVALPEPTTGPSQGRRQLS